MSAVNATVKALLGNAAVVAIVASRVYPGQAAQGALRPHIVVHLVSQHDAMLLLGPAKYPESRVSIECRADTFTAANDLGEVVIEVLPALHMAAYAGKSVSFRQEGSDYSDFDDASQTHRRIMDFYARWQ